MRQKSYSILPYIYVWWVEIVIILIIKFPQRPLRYATSDVEGEAVSDTSDIEVKRVYATIDIQGKG